MSLKQLKSGKEKRKKRDAQTLCNGKKYLKALCTSKDDVSEQVDSYLDEIVLSEARFKDVKAKYSQYDDTCRQQEII